MKLIVFILSYFYIPLIAMQQNECSSELNLEKIIKKVKNHKSISEEEATLWAAHFSKKYDNGEKLSDSPKKKSLKYNNSEIKIYTSRKKKKRCIVQ